MGGREGAWPLHHVRRKSSRRACPRVVPAAVDLRPAGRESRESNGPTSASLCRWRIAWDWISWASIPGRPLLSGAAVTFRGGRYFPGRPLLSGTAVTFRDGGYFPGRRWRPGAGRATLRGRPGTGRPGTGRQARRAALVSRVCWSWGAPLPGEVGVYGRDEVVEVGLLGGGGQAAEPGRRDDHAVAQQETRQPADLAAGHVVECMAR